MSECLLEDFYRWQGGIRFADVYGEGMWIGERHFIRYVYEECSKRGIDPERAPKLAETVGWDKVLQFLK